MELEKKMVESHPLLSGTGTWPPGGLASELCLQYGAATAWLLALLRVQRVQAEVLSLRKHDGCAWQAGMFAVAWRSLVPCPQMYCPAARSP